MSESFLVMQHLKVVSLEKDKEKGCLM